jgi:anti-sigma regulatory factor (Ser/Thr protein kinase)
VDLKRNVQAQVRLRVEETSGVGHARRTAQALATELGFDDVEIGEVGIVVTEAATNLVKHAGHGELFLRPLLADGRDAKPAFTGLEVLALDRGPGIHDLAQAERDGWSSAGTLGLGLGSIARLSGYSDVYSRPKGGLALLAQLRRSEDPPAARPAHDFRIGAVNVAHPAETVCGDGWTSERIGGRLRVLVVDGVGHGSEAARAAETALGILPRTRDSSPTQTLERIHDALRPTRGAAATLIDIDPDRRVARSCGVGNVCASVQAAGTTRHLVAHNGTLGHGHVRIQEFQSPWPADALLVMYSDGLQSRWNLDAYPGIAERHPTLIAGVLYRDFARGNDDATVVVVKELAP